MLSQLKSFSKFGVICGSGKEPLRIAKLLSEAGNSVFIIKNGRAQKRLVSISHKEPGYIYLNGGLNKNDEVVISRLAGIGEGVKLRSKYE